MAFIIIAGILITSLPTAYCLLPTAYCLLRADSLYLKMPWGRKCYLDSAAALWDDSLIMEPDPLPTAATAALAAACGPALLARGWRLAVAESCTGGGWAIA